jgi:transposase
MADDRSEAATVAATVAAPMQRIEIVAERRRAHNEAFRREMVARSLEPGVRVRELARQHGICASLIYRWRREQAEGGPASGTSLLPVHVVSQDVAPRHPPPAPLPVRPPGSIEIELDGGVRVRVGDDVSLTALRRVMAALRG